MTSSGNEPFDEVPHPDHSQPNRFISHTPFFPLRTRHEHGSEIDGTVPRGRSKESNEEDLHELLLQELREGNQVPQVWVQGSQGKVPREEDGLGRPG